MDMVPVDRGWLEWIGFVLWWSDEGAARSARILSIETGYLDSAFRGRVLSLPSGGEIGLTLIERIYYVLFQWTHIEALLIHAQGLDVVGEAARATLNTIQIFVVRLTITILALPLFGLAVIWGFGEGLIRRELRKYGGDIERGFWYHQLKKWSAAVLILPLIAYLSLPITLNPAYLFVPFAVIFALLIMGTSALFIKNA